MNAEVYASPDGWRFRVKGDNGEIMCTGESYVRRIDAEHALRTLFGIGQQTEVVVRNHHNEVVDHYTVGVTPDYTPGDAEEERGLWCPVHRGFHPSPVCDAADPTLWEQGLGEGDNDV